MNQYDTLIRFIITFGVIVLTKNAYRAKQDHCVKNDSHTIEQLY
ncbi:hypothetical protein [Leptospira borgpetersenii]